MIGVVVPPEDLAPGDTISGVLADVVRQLDYAPDDPRRVIIACAERIAAVLDEGAAPAQLVRELRGCLSDLERNPAGPAMPRDEFRARRHLRRLSMMLPGPEGPPAGHPAQHWVHGGG